MDINKMTERTQQAFTGGQELANERGNPELTELHLLKALMEQDESLLIRILSESGKSVNLFDIELNKELDRLPEVSGGVSQVYMSSSLQQVLTAAEKEMQMWEDEY
ncbi:Chaperone protein ClpB [Peribacillus frigoritolerans]